MPGKKWTQEEEQILKEMFPDNKTQLIADTLGRTYRSVSLHAMILGLKKSSEYLNSEASGRMNITQPGIANRFKKGAAPFNKGMKQSDWLSKESIKKIRTTQFKKGQRPANAPPVGTETIQSHKGRKYRVVGGRYVHVLNWEKEYGKIPEGSFIRCKTPDTLNTDPSNWELVNRSQNMQKNSFLNYPEPIYKTIQLKGALTRQINKHLKKFKNEK